MYTKLVLVVVAVVPLLVSCDRPTHCERHNGDAEFRCGKDGYKKDTIFIGNIAGDNVSFRVLKWYSVCGKPGVNYADDTYSLESGGHMDVEFPAAKSGVCHEIYVYQCKRQNNPTNCLNVVVVQLKL